MSKLLVLSIIGTIAAWNTSVQASPATARGIVSDQKASSRNESPGVPEILQNSNKVQKKRIGTKPSSQIAEELDANKKSSKSAPVGNPSGYSNRAQGTVSTPIATAKVAAKKSPFSLKIRDYTALNMPGFDNVGGSDKEAYAWDRINFTYAASENISFSVMPQFNRTWFGKRDRNQDGDGSTIGLDQNYSGYVGNTGLIFTDSKLATFTNGFVLDALVRYDIPTSQVSQTQGSLGETWLGVGISKSVGIVDFKVTEIVRNYLQQFTTSNVVTASDPTKHLQNPYIRVYSLLDIGVNITKKLSFGFETGFLNERRYADNSTGRSEKMIDSVIVNPDIGYNFSDNLSLDVGIWEQPDMRSLSTSYVPLAADAQNNSEVYLLTTIKF